MTTFAEEMKIEIGSLHLIAVGGLMAGLLDPRQFIVEYQVVHNLLSLLLSTYFPVCGWSRIEMAGREIRDGFTLYLLFAVRDEEIDSAPAFLRRKWVSFFSEGTHYDRRKF